jgi:hypothetical protein
MEDERNVPGMPVLDRQERAAPSTRLDARGRPVVPARVPEVRPTPLQELFIPLSVITLLCGVLAISALELGTPLSALIVKAPVLVGGGILAAVTSDAVVRIWRSAKEWLPVDPGRAAFRIVWVVTLVASLVLLAFLGVFVVRA